jgi:DNA helicase IV
MALRMIGRRATKGSMTVLGDLAQATSPASLDSWSLTVEHLLAAGAGRSREQTQPTGTDLEVDHRSEADADSAAVQLTELTVGYRVPAAILDVANRLLVEAAPTVTPARSVRPGGEPPRVTMVDPDQVGAAVAAEVEALQTRSFSIAVVAEAEQLSALSEALTMAGISADRVGGSGLPGRDAVAMLDPLGAKGLEFDAVIVVEPGLIAELPSGLRHLYVAMTRPVQYLGLVHSRPLPGLLGLSG